MHALLEPWGEPFLVRAFFELVLVGAAGAAVGSWVVLYRLSYSAESLAHAMFPGLVAASLLGLPLLAGGAAGVAVAAGGTAIAGRIPGLGRDNAVAIVVTTLFGAGALLALAPASPPGIDELLFGDPLAVTRRDLVVATIAVAVIGSVLVAMHRQLLAVGFDRAMSRVLGARTLLTDLVLLVLTGIVVVVGVQALGNLLVVAVVVGPAATARLLTTQFRPMVAVGCAISVCAAAGGLYLSYYAGLATGASVAAVIVAAYAAAVIWRRARGRTRY